MSTLARYNTLYESLRSRRRRADAARGLDALAVRARVAFEKRGIALRVLREQAERIDREFSPALRSSSDGVLDQRVIEARERFVRARRQDDPELLPRSLALTREIARRVTGEEAFVVQLMGALALCSGSIIEMLTGEGKTLTGSLAAPLLAWRHKHLHVFTVNDYLAGRDAESRGRVFRRCGLSVGAIQQETPPRERAEIYSRAIVFGTPKQITADWLRDQLRLGAGETPWSARRAADLGSRFGMGSADEGAQIPGLRAAMVDEADAVLIDEGVVPLIIAQARRADDMGDVYRSAAAIARSLDLGADYAIDHVTRRALLKPRGRHRCAAMFASLPHPIFKATRRAEELVRVALIAQHGYRRGEQYQIVDGRVVIVDEYTGRFLADRSWEHGLHQAVEAKESLEVTADRETLARLSFQRFFRTYPFLCGMTGTAADAATEMVSVYQRPVTVIPTNRPVVRREWPARVFRAAEDKWSAIVSSIADLHALGRPILVGTRSIEASEQLSARLAARSLPHRVLNANFDKEEADLIVGAGRLGSIIVATNMAGRGTDIIPEARARELGGLHVILTEMHAAKRIDRQFIGRAGRQGDPGSAQLFVSLDDEIVRLYAPAPARLARRSMQSGEAAPNRARLLLRLFRYAQRLAERRARVQRVQLMHQDHWTERHLPGT
jgi:preprotein translocase subunit SecA